MFKETINSTKNSKYDQNSPVKFMKANESDNDSIFNIEFNDIPG